jgi:Protein of unknown function (DUF3987)/DnaB-like helicase N terminal domain
VTQDARNSKQTASDETYIPRWEEECEKIVLGTILQDASVFPKLQRLLRPGALHLPLHRKVLEACVKLTAQNIQIDTITVRIEVEYAGVKLDAVDIEYIERLTEYASTAESLKHYVDRIHKAEIWRRLDRLSSETQKRSRGNEAEPADVLREMVAEASRLAELQRGRDGATADIVEPIATVQAEYSFVSPCGPDHFVTKWIDYASQRTDAAHEYHEAAALIQLAAGTPNLRAELTQTTHGLAGNLYVMSIGDSTISRKTTSARFAQDVIDEAIPGSLCADQITPEGLVETLATRSADCTTWYVDEFADLLRKFHSASYMAGIEGLILNIYDGGNYTHRRHTKRSSSGTRTDDFDEIKRPHLSILGVTTPSIFETISHRDVTSGLLPRFAIVFPRNKPQRRSLSLLSTSTKAERDNFVDWVRRLHQWNIDKRRQVNFAEGTLERLDGFAAAIERNPPESDVKRTMLERLNAMTHKLAILIAAGRPGVVGNDFLTVELEDVDAAIIIAQRFQRDALLFAERVGESDFERTVQRCLRIVNERGTVLRRVIAQNAHVRAKILDDVRDTLEDRGLVIVNRSPSEGRPGELWLKHV